MKNLTVIDKSYRILEADVVFSFYCKKTKKNYIALNYKKDIFEKNSIYNNLDLLEITKEEKNIIHVSEIESSEWDDVKYALQYQIFSNIKE